MLVASGIPVRATSGTGMALARTQIAGRWPRPCA